LLETVGVPRILASPRVMAPRSVTVRMWGRVRCPSGLNEKVGDLATSPLDGTE
jgi:hypothetical protein